MKKKKLELKKKTIATLSDSESKNIAGGDAYTTSFSDCTHFICCGDNCTTTQKTIKTVLPANCGSVEATWCPGNSVCSCD